ncbi:MAG TPA: GNAT family N-acetyltransferase [Gemmatimonadota bacterium]
MPELRTTRRDLATLLPDLRLGWRNARLPGVLAELRARTLDRAWRSHHFLAGEFDLERLPPTPPCPPGVSIRPLDERDWPALAAIIPARRMPFFRRGWETGMHGLVAWRGPAPVGYAFYRLDHPVDAHLLTFELPANELYLGPRYVLPSERGAGVGTALAAARLARGREAGRRRAYNLVHPRNLGSLISLSRAAGPDGTRVLGELRHRRLFGRTWSSWRPAAARRPLRAR